MGSGKKVDSHKSFRDDEKQSGLKDVEFARSSGPHQPSIRCPDCGSERVWLDGLRKTGSGVIQRHLCRDCGLRFSESAANLKVKVDVTREVLEVPNPRDNHVDGPIASVDPAVEKVPDEQSFFRGEDVGSHGSSHNGSVAEDLNTLRFYTSKRQVRVSEGEARNLAEVESRTEERAAGATVTPKTIETILDYAWQMKKRGLTELTIKQRVYRLKLLARNGADLVDPETVSTVLARSDWTESNKRVFIVAYKSFADLHSLAWRPPKTRVEDKVPFIPTEEEIDQLIAGCGRKTATFLQVLKDTAARTAEALRLKWVDLDEKSNTIRINNPVKGSRARVVKVSPKTIAMINNMPQTGEMIFKAKPHTMRQNFQSQRRKIARILQNPRLLQIHLHTFRHWKATMEYHRTNNIKYVQQLLGHKNLKHTDRYTQLINFESDEWHVSHARNLAEESKLIEAGFEYVRYSEKDEVAIYRKRK